VGSFELAKFLSLRLKEALGKVGIGALIRRDEPHVGVLGSEIGGGELLSACVRSSSFEQIGRERSFSGVIKLASFWTLFSAAAEADRDPFVAAIMLAEKPLIPDAAVAKINFRRFNMIRSFPFLSQRMLNRILPNIRPDRS